MKTKRTLLTSAMTLALMVLGVSVGLAEELKPVPNKEKMEVTPRLIAVREATPGADHATEQVRIQLDRSDRVYEEEDKLTITVESSKSGYLYLICLPESDEYDPILLLPNKFTDNALRIEAGKAVTYPSKESRFEFRVVLPPNSRATTEHIVAFVTSEPLDLEKAVKSLGDDNYTVLTGHAFDQMLEEIRKAGSKFVAVVEKEDGVTEEAQDVANEILREYIDYQIVGKRERTDAEPKRYAYGFATSDYKDDRIHNLPGCRVDLEGFAKIAVDRLGVASGDVYTKLNPTKKDVKEGIASLKSLTKPGDTIFIFWTGHGAVGADLKLNNNSCYLLPTESNLNDSVNTMIDDTEFGNWVKELQGRQIFVFIDACHAAGMAENAKGLGDSKSLSSNTSDEVKFEFAFNFFGKADADFKSISQSDSFVLCSCAVDQLSFLNSDRSKGSVATYYLFQVLNDKKNDRITQADLQREVQKGVDGYFKSEGKGRSQKILVQDLISGAPVLLIKK
ncbi:MAG: caspase family protein [Planctomycetia bacterium]|nr:caspase family protein [Planctomycetia bacterium]